MVYINSVKQLDVFPAFDAETKSFFFYFNFSIVKKLLIKYHSVKSI
jgi:hypothetical protein